MSENQEGKDTTCVRRNHVFKQTIFIAVWNWGELPTMASAPAAKDHQGQKENKKEQESKAEEEKRQKSWWFWKSQNEQGKRFDKTPRVQKKARVKKRFSTLIAIIPVSTWTISMTAMRR